MKLKLMIVTVLLAATAGWAQTEAAPQAQQSQGQGQGQRRGRGMRMQGNFRGTAGTISEINGDTITIKDMRGTVVTVKVTSSTEYRKDGQAAKLADFKVGDAIVVRGDSNGENSWTATGVMSNPGMAMMREQLGKKFIAGEVTKIDETKLTLKRVDGETQVIEVDENTSFRNAKRESVTLADIKVGDHVVGRGDLKDGTFVPTTLNVGGPGEFMMRRPGGPEAGSNETRPEKQ